MANHFARTCVTALLLLVVIAGASVAFVNAGRWLMVEDPLAHAGAIAVLGGNLPMRTLAAADLF
jgi:hypothetical protein